MNWQLPDEAFRYLRRLPMGATVLELGSGDGTARLIEMGFKVYSVEHDPEWVGRVPGALYIHAPIVDGWYDAEIIKRSMPSRYECLIVDGPPGSIGRQGMLKHMDLFWRRSPVLVDDVHRQAERVLLLHLVKEWGVPFSVHHIRDRAFATFGWGDL